MDNLQQLLEAVETPGLSVCLYVRKYYTNVVLTLQNYWNRW